MESTIGQRIRQLREAKQLTVAELAKTANVKASAIYGLESDANKPSIDTVRALWLAFPDLNTEWLQFGVGQMFKDGRSLVLAQSPAPEAVAAEPVAPYACMSPTTVVPLSRQLAEAHTRIQELEAELKEERKQARQDLRLQATYYNSVKEDQAQLITRLYAKLDEYELALGYRKPTAAERKQQEQAGSSAPRLEMIPFGARYRTSLADEPQPTECVVREMYPAAEVSHCEAA